MMTHARAQTLMLAVTVVLVLTSSREQLRGRLQTATGERGSQTLEWAIIAAIVVGIAAVVGAKIIGAVNTHAAQIK